MFNLPRDKLASCADTSPKATRGANFIIWEIAEKNWSCAPYLCSLARRNNMGRGAFERGVRILRGLALPISLVQIREIFRCRLKPS